MERKTIYICEYCRTSYETEEKAKECEAFHAKVESIEGMHFCPSPFVKYPTRLDVMMNDGYCVAYVLDQDE